MSGLDHGEDVSAGSQLHFEAEMLSMSWQPAEQRRHSEGPSDFPNELDEQDEDMVVDPSVAVLDAQDDFRPIPVHWKIEKSFVAPFTHTCRSSNFGLPAYIRCTTRRYTKDQIDVLSQGGAMSIPERSARDALVHAFTFYVFPTMPILHLSDFLAALDTTQGAVLDSQVSLLLFQAVMFAGTAHVNLTVLHQLGFTDRTSARAAFFMKVKVSSERIIHAVYHLLTFAMRIASIRSGLGKRSNCHHPDHSAIPNLVHARRRIQRPLALAWYCYRSLQVCWH